MTEVPAVVREFRGKFSKEEVFAWIDSVLDANKRMDPQAILVSNSLSQMGVSGDHRGVKIVMDPDFYPEDRVRIVY